MGNKTQSIKVYLDEWLHNSNPYNKDFPVIELEEEVLTRSVLVEKINNHTKWSLGILDSLRPQLYSYTLLNELLTFNVAEMMNINLDSKK